MKVVLRKAIMLCLLVILIPYILTLYFGEKSEQEFYGEYEEIQIIDNTTNGNCSLSTETYLIGAVAAAVPITCQKETLKAQAVICRTTLYNKLKELKCKGSSIYTIESMEQPYISEEELVKFLGEKKADEYLPVLREAVKDTNAQVLEQPVPLTFLLGADRDAKQGKLYKEILKSYFPSIKIKQIKK